MVFKSDFHILKAALVLAFVSTGGWLVFRALVDLFNLNQLSPIWRLLLGLAIILISFKLGLRKKE